MSIVLDRPDTFDHTDRLNEDGTVTFSMTPSNWHAYNISPDTYSSFNGDSWVESHIDYANECIEYPQYHETPEWAYLGRPVTYDDFDWTYDHSAIVRGLAEVAADWIRDTLWDLGLESVSDVKVQDTWSPKFYNFQSDGFEVEITCDPAELRALTADFDLDDHGHEFYRSRDGFMSYVTGRLEDDEWRAGYDGEFRVEALLASADTYDDRSWVMALAEAEYEIYSDNVRVEFIHPEIEDSGYTMPELEEWAATFGFTQTETLPGL